MRQRQDSAIRPRLTIEERQQLIKEPVSTSPNAQIITITESGQLQEAELSNFMVYSTRLVSVIGMTAALVLTFIYQRTLEQTETDRDGNKWVQSSITRIIEGTGLTRQPIDRALKSLIKDKFIVCYRDFKTIKGGLWYAINLAPREQKKQIRKRPTFN